MQEKKFIVVQTTYGVRLGIPLEHPMAGSFLSIMKEVVLLDSWSGDSAVTGKYEWGITYVKPHSLAIEDIKVYSEEELAAHRADVPVVVAPPSAPGASSDLDNIPF